MSELFEVGAPTREIMIAGLIGYGIAVLAATPTLHRELPGRSWLLPAALTLNAVGTLALVAVPCNPGCPDPGTAVDRTHTVVATLLYAGLALAPLVGGVRAWRSRRAFAWWSLFSAAATTGPLLAIAAGAEPVGLLQQLGTSSGHAWLVSAAYVVLKPSGRLTAAA